MKSPVFIFSTSLIRTLVGSLALLIAAHGSAAPAPVRDATTHEQLSLKRGQMERKDPMKNMAVSRIDDPALNLPKDLVSQSDVISFDGIATLVPKRAILQIPKGYESRLKIAPDAQIKSWAEFYAINRGWITTVEVSFAQAEGKVPIPEATSKQFTKSGNLVVAVYLGGPISMLPLKAPVENVASARVGP